MVLPRRPPPGRLAPAPSATACPGAPHPLGLRPLLSGAALDIHRLNAVLLWERLDQCPGAVPVIACHDEAVIAWAEGQAVAAGLRQGLLEAVPVAVAVAVG